MTDTDKKAPESEQDSTTPSVPNRAEPSATSTTTTNEEKPSNKISSEKKGHGTRRGQRRKGARSSHPAARPKPAAKPEATSEPTPTAPQTPPQAVQSEASESKKSGNTVAWVALVLAIGLGGGLFYHGHQQAQQFQTQISQLNTALSQTKTQAQSATQQVVSQVQQVAQSSENNDQDLKAQIGAMQVSLADLRGRRPNDWLIAEADYLVKMAGRKLWLEHDLVASATLLKSADARIRELNDPSLLNVRDALNADIATLRALPQVDRDALVLRLSTLTQQVDELQLAQVELPEAAHTPDVTLSTDASDWQDNLKRSWTAFSENFITIRRRDGHIEPLLSPKQNWFLRENLKAKLQEATLAVYREQPEVYRNALATAKDWTQEFYLPKDSNTEFFVQELDKLSQQSIKVDYPLQLKSQPLVSDLVDTRIRVLLNSGDQS